MRVWLHAAATTTAVLGLAAIATKALAEENRVERWMCTPAGLAALYCSESFGAKNDDSDCTKVSLTADMSDGTGTIQVTGMPEESTHFTANQFDRVWAWPFDSPRYVFGINYKRTGFYFASLPSEGAEPEPAGVFHCQRGGN